MHWHCEPLFRSASVICFILRGSKNKIKQHFWSTTNGGEYWFYRKNHCYFLYTQLNILKLKSALHGQTTHKIKNLFSAWKHVNNRFIAYPAAPTVCLLLILRLFVNTLTETHSSILIETVLDDGEHLKKGRTKNHTFSLHDCLYTIGKIQNGWTQLSNGDVNTTRLMKDTDWKFNSSNLIHKAHQWQLKIIKKTSN